MNTTRRYVWKNQNDINLLINGSRNLSETLQGLSAYVNALARKVHIMWVSRHLQMVVERVGNELEQSRLEFERYRNIALEVESGRLTTNLLDETDLQSVLRCLRGAPMPLGWYYAFTPVKLVTISDEQIIFAADLWSRSKDTYEEWSLLAFPVRDQGFRKRTIVHSPIITDTKRQFVFQPSVCRGLSAKVCIISHIEKHACELGLTSGTPNECQLELTPRNVPRNGQSNDAWS